MGLRERLVQRFAGDLMQQVASDAAAQASAETEKRVREAFPAALTADDRSLMESGYRRLTTNQSNRSHPQRDLQPLAQDWMCRVVYWLWESNPLARWLVETTVDFVLGEGVVIESDVPAVHDVLKEFWADPVNQLDRRLDAFTREYGLYGELCLQVFVNPVDGHVRIGYVDPLEIDRVITDPDNALVQQAVLLKGRVSGAPESGPILKVVRAETDRSRRAYGLLMPNEPGEADLFTGRVYDGACFLFQTNKISNGRRGRSDLLSSIDWLDGYDAFLFDSMDNANLFNSFVYDAKLEGFTEAQIKDWLGKFGTGMKRGQVFAHNEKVTLSEVTPDLKALDKDAFARLYRGHILGGHSFPEHWYGLAGEVNFASAKEMGLPPVKRLTRRQKEVRYIVADLVTFALHQAIRASVLPREQAIDSVNADGSSTRTSKPTDQCVSIRLPELSMRDQSSTVAAVTSLVAALTQAKAEGWVRQETAGALFAHVVNQLGMEITADEEVTPTPKGGAATADYAGAQQMLARLQAQLKRDGEGNGNNINEPKRTTPVGGQRASETFDESKHPRHPAGSSRGGEFAASDALPSVAVATDDPTDYLAIESGAGDWLVRHALRDAKLPALHYDGLTGIKFHEGALIPSATDPIGAYGTYSPRDRMITLSINAKEAGGNVSVFGGNVVLHELGHHVHIYKLTDAAADEWAQYSDKGQRARISAYARTNQGEHFAEAYRAYTAGSEKRRALKNLEPEAYKFMASLMRDNSPRLHPQHHGASYGSWEGRYRG